MSSLDLISCRHVNCTLNAIISSPHIQHLIDADLAGNLNTPLPLLEPRRALELRRKAWESYEPQHVINFNSVLHFYDFIQDGMYFNLYNPQVPGSVSYCWAPRPEQCLDEVWSCSQPFTEAE